ncbi:MAG: type II toxin-antitoxin system RelB/DinJ family antitoxin [Candidatus Peribacteraceae bacterium]
MPATAVLTIRIDEKLKRQSQRVIEQWGFDLSSAVRLFLTQVVRTKSIPFKVSGEKRRKRK